MQQCLFFFNSVYSCTTARSTQYLSTPSSSLFSFLVQQCVSDLCLLQTGQQHSFFFQRHPPAYSAFIRNCPFHYNILNDIKDHSTSSRNRNKGTGVTSNHDNEAHRGSESVFYSLIWALQNEWLFLCASARTLLNFHCLQVTIYYQISGMENTTSKSL